MRPVLLKMCGFGPYADETIIEMDRLGDKGLYLICGDTGAGKTTIFDAICYALFGKTSSNERENKLLRSKYAAPKTKTYVELEFIYRNKKYTINRNPEYMRPKEKGEGETKQSASAVLYMPDGSVYTKENEIASKIKDILGVDREQFCKIAMLAQGEFRKLLTASTDERVKIFRDIFGTIKYQELQNKLAADAKLNFNECKEITSSIYQYVAGVINYEMPEEDEKYNALITGECTITESIDIITEIINQGDILYEKLLKDISETDSKLTEINAQLTETEQIIEIKKSIDLNENELNEIFPKIQLAKEEVLELEKSNKKEELNKVIINEEAHLDEYVEVENKKKLLYEKQNKLKKLTEKISSDKDEQLKLCKKIELLQQELKQIEKCDTKQLAVEGELKVLLELKSKLNKLCEYKAQIYKYRQKYEAAQTECKNSLIQAQDYAKKYNDIFQKFLSAQAGILAKDLKENAPCPVCGSKQHPKLAPFSENTVTEQMLEAAKQDNENVQEKAKVSSREAAVRKQEYESEIKQFVLLWQEIFDEKIDEADFDSESNNTHFEKFEAQNLQNIDKLKDEAEEINKNISRKKVLEKELPIMQKNSEEIIANLHMLEKDAASLESFIISEKENIEQLKSKLTFETIDEAQNSISEKKALLKKYEDEYTLSKNNYENLKNKKLSLEAIINSLTEQLKQNSKIIRFKEEVLVESLIEIKEELYVKQQNFKSKKEENENAVLKLHSALSNNKSCIEKIKAAKQQLDKTQEKWQIIDALNKTANGANNSDIKLETYVQMAYFDKVIGKANLRLMIMSNNQYELRRIEDVNDDTKSVKKDGRKNFGLDLEVIDHFNGTSRSVKTLSGGESFLASLALALGMSDEIGESAGGIKLDTMFVDEGFGSLDEESLSQAMKVLRDLSSGERLVGIISHVAELKENIDKQIIVRKRRAEGSFAQLII